jgi:hypothetical protein
MGFGDPEVDLLVPSSSGINNTTKVLESAHITGVAT